MINEITGYIVVFTGGLALGGVFFGGLWLTVSRMAHTTQPALMFVASAFIRTAAVLGGIWLLTKGDLFRLAACLSGFLLIRIFMVHHLGHTKQELSGDISR